MNLPTFEELDNLSVELKERVTEVRKVVQIHPFNFSDSRVNIVRANQIIEFLAMVCLDRNTQAIAWWPQDAASFVEAVRKEREEMDRLGYLVAAKREKR